MDKGKTTRILSGGTYIGRDGKLHKWRKIHGYKPAKITDDNWMEYGMPSDDETNESKNMSKKVIRLKEGDLHRIVKESVDKVLGYEDSSDIQNKLIDYCLPMFTKVLKKYPNIEVETDGERIFAYDDSGYGITVKFEYTMF